MLDSSSYRWNEANFILIDAMETAQQLQENISHTHAQ